MRARSSLPTLRQLSYERMLHFTAVTAKPQLKQYSYYPGQRDVIRAKTSLFLLSLAAAASLSLSLSLHHHHTTNAPCFSPPFPLSLHPILSYLIPPHLLDWRGTTSMRPLCGRWCAPYRKWGRSPTDALAPDAYIPEYLRRKKTKREGARSRC